MSTVLFWRRTDVIGVERLEFFASRDEVVAESSLVCVEDGGFRMEHRWRLDAAWRALRLDVDKWGGAGHQRLTIERAGDRWLVDDEARPDLDGADEPDLSVTPFCNTLPMRRLPALEAATLTLDTCYVDAATMTVKRSRQRYERLGPRRVRYVDLGTSKGFEAVIDIDDDGLVTDYEHLFRRVEPLPS